MTLNSPNFSSVPDPFDPLTCPQPDPRLTAQVVEDSILDLWEVVNRLSLLQIPKRDRYAVTIFGSARLPKTSPIYAGVHNLAAELTQLGCDIITGGGPGLMEAANQGSVVADTQDQTQSVGIRVKLEFEQNVNPFVEQAYQHRTFFSRLHHFVLRSDAFVVVPGGIGTTLEAAMIWQLLQVGNLHQTPLVMVGPMWTEFVSWAKAFMVDGEFPMAQPVDMAIPHCVQGFDEAIAILKADQQRWRQNC